MISVRVPIEILEELDNKANSLGLSRSKAVNQLLESWYDHEIKTTKLPKNKKKSKK